MRGNWRLDFEGSMPWARCVSMSRLNWQLSVEARVPFQLPFVCCLCCPFHFCERPRLRPNSPAQCNSRFATRLKPAKHLGLVPFQARLTGGFSNKGSETFERTSKKHPILVGSRILRQTQIVSLALHMFYGPRSGSCVFGNLKQGQNVSP